MLSARSPAHARIAHDQPSRRMGPRVEQLGLDGSTEQVARYGIAAQRDEQFELHVTVDALRAPSVRGSVRTPAGLREPCARGRSPARRPDAWMARRSRTIRRRARLRR